MTRSIIKNRCLSALLTGLALACGGPRVVPVEDAGTNEPFDAGATVIDSGTPIDVGGLDGGFRDAGTPDAGPSPVIDSGVMGNNDGIVRFVAFGDQGKSNDDQRKVGTAVGKVCAEQGCDFVLLLGDNFYPQNPTTTSDPVWQTAFVEPYSTVDAGFYVTLGNHDYGGNGTGNEFGREKSELDYAKINPKWILPAHHYKFVAGPAEFFCADTNRSMWKKDAQTRADMEAWLKASTSTWKIVFGHHTYLSNGKHGNAGNYDGLSVIPIVNGEGVKSFVDDVVCGRADFYLDGHDHEREWIKKTCSRAGSTMQTEFIVSGGGASVNGFDGAGATPYWWRSEANGFLYVIIRGRTLIGTFYSSDGVAEYSRTLTK